MEEDALVVAVLGMRGEVGDGAWTLVREELDGDVTLGRVDDGATGEDAALAGISACMVHVCGG